MRAISPFVHQAGRSDYRRIAEELRQQIASGKLIAGAKLPAMEKLAEVWETSFGTVHNALEALSKEGWVERAHGSGTFVADFKTRFTCAGIYYDHNIFSDEESAFSRSLNSSLLTQLGALGKETMVFADARPLNRQATVLPALAEAITHRRVQCVIAPVLNKVACHAMGQLNIPTVFCTHQTSNHRVNFNLETLISESVRFLAGEGCRSIGLMTCIKPPTKKHIKDYYDNFFPLFWQGVQAEGRETRESWIRNPTRPITEMELFGYREFKKLWGLAEKPDGMLIYPDVVARGAILAILELGIEKVIPRMKFVLHRNSHIPFICPFPAMWAISSEDLLAKEQIQMIQRQFNGEKVEPVFLAHTLKHERPTR